MNRIPFPSLHVPPALRHLLWLQWISLGRRFRTGFASPRKAILSALAILLAVFWLGNAVVSILFRAPYEPETLRRGVLASLTVYLCWPIIKAATRRPAEAIEWSASENELVCLGPFTRHELLSYRACVILSSTLLKTVCLTLLLLTDLGSVGLGLLGILLALLFLDAARMMTEIAFWSLSPRIYLAVRCLVLLATASALMACTIDALQVPRDKESNVPAAFAHILQLPPAACRLFDTPPGSVLSAVMQPFVQVMTANGPSLPILGWLAASILLVLGAWSLALSVDRRACARWSSGVLDEISEAGLSARSRVAGRRNLDGLRTIRHLGGMGPIAWRQGIGARRYLTSLLIALIVPAALSCLPLVSDLPALGTFLNVVAALVFYSFLLLPAALKFDFRRDCDRLAILKTLPIRPSAVVIGQLATPVLLATLQQSAVLLVVMLVRPVSPGLVLGALLFLIPVNVMIFGLDNLIFLLYPHRLNQEGLQVFLRVTLTFTAKGLLFGIGLGIVYAWAVSVRIVATLPVVSLVSDHRIVFGMGLWGLTTVTGLMLTCLLTWAFSRYDPSLDTPAT